MKQASLLRAVGSALGVWFMLMIGIPIGQAQGSYTPITKENVADLLQIQRIGNGVPRAMTFSADGSRLAVATTLGVWVIDMDEANAQPCDPSDKACRLIEGQGGVESATFSPDGTKIAAGGDDNSVMVFDAATGAVVAKLVNHIYPISAVAWSSDGKWIASGDWSGVVRLWDTAKWSEYRVFSTTEKIEQLTFDAQGTITASSADARTSWDIASGNVISQSESTGGLGYNVTPEANEQHADYSADEGQIKIWDKTTLVATLDGFYSELGGVFFSSDGRVGASPTKPTYLWSVASGQPDNTAQPLISPDGTRKATFGNDGVIRLFDVKSGNLIAQLHGHIRAVNDVAFSPDGKLLASASNDDTIQLWDATVTQDSGSLMTLKGHTSGVTSVAFNADGTLLASASFDGTIRLWGVAAAIG